MKVAHKGSRVIMTVMELDCWLWIKGCVGIK